MRVLLVEDDVDVADVTSYALRKQGHEVIVATDGENALERWEAHQPDLVLLDLNLPRLSGLDVCRAIRQQAETPIIIVTAQDDDDDVAEGLGAGADDYISKPVSYRTLLMRMQAVRRRAVGGMVLDQRSLVRAGDLVVDLDGHECTRGGESIRLTQLELRILYHLVSNAGRILRTPRLIELVWGYDGGDPDALKTHISNIRHKLGIAKDEPGYISAVPHVGYRLVVEDPAASSEPRAATSGLA